MTGDAYSQEWPGHAGWGHRAHGPGSPFAEGKGKGRGRGRRSYPSPEDFERWAAMRHMRGGPFGPGSPFGGGGGPRGRGRGRARRGDVRLGLLLLLAEEPRNGYQLMQTIEERSDGRWRPSPGSVYPTLALLEDEGLIRATELDGTKVFELTDAGRAQAAEHGDAPAPWASEDDAEDTGANLRALIGGIATAALQVHQAGSEAQIAKAADIMREARRELYRILAEDPEA